MAGDTEAVIVFVGNHSQGNLESHHNLLSSSLAIRHDAKATPLSAPLRHRTHLISN